MSPSTVSSLETRILSVGADTLTPIAQRATDCNGSVTRWEITPVKVSIGGMGQNAIYRFTGGIQGVTDEVPWSSILKVISPALPGTGPQHNKLSDYRREYEFYRSDLGRLFPAGFRAAHCYAQHEQENEEGQGEYWLWLEDLAPYAKSEWSLENNYQAAFALGKFNGVFLVDHPLPAAPWLKTNHVRQYLDLAGPFFQRLFEQRDYPIFRRFFPPTEVDSLAALWQSREEHLKTLERLPQTLCHGDAQYTNLFLINGANGDVEIVAIDWEGIGLASIGMDLAQMLMMSLISIDTKSPHALVQALFQGYQDGLQVIGWRGDPRVIRLGFTSAVLRARTTFVLRPFSFVSDEGISKFLQHWLDTQGITLEEYADRFAWIHGFLRQLFEESLELREQLL